VKNWVLHFTWKCVWALGREDVAEHMSTIQERDARSWLSVLTSTLTHEEMTRVVVTMWAIWYARRKVILENSFQSPLSTHNFVERFISELCLINPQKIQQSCNKASKPRWIPPPAGVAKINVDATVSKNSDHGSAAAVARDESGRFPGVSALVIEGITELELLEALACREGMSLAKDLFLHKIKLASDFANVVRSIFEHELGPYGHVVWEISAGRTDFQSFELVHEGQRSNVDAHKLARGSLGAGIRRHVWLLDPPNGVCFSISASHACNLRKTLNFLALQVVSKVALYFLEKLKV
jgi:hypothetical protein